MRRKKPFKIKRRFSVDKTIQLAKKTSNPEIKICCGKKGKVRVNTSNVQLPTATMITIQSTKIKENLYQPKTKKKIRENNTRKKKEREEGRKFGLFSLFLWGFNREEKKQ